MPCPIGIELSFKEALGHLDVHGWFFVAVEGTLQGIVTRHDLGRPVVSLGLRRFLGTFTNTPITDSLSVDDGEGAPRYFSAVVNLSWKEADRLTALGFSTN